MAASTIKQISDVKPEGPGARPGQMRLSILVIAINSLSVLYRCLEALERVVDYATMEVFVVGRWSKEPEAVYEGFFEQFKGVQRVIAGPEMNVPQMRMLGLKMAGGEIVALLEDDCVVEEGWCRRLIAAHESTDIGMGGCIRPGPYKRFLDWAVFFCEYARFMPPCSESEHGILPGNNLSYKRRALLQFLAGDGADRQSGFYETDVQFQLEAAGFRLRLRDDLVVRNINSWGLKSVLSAPYHHGRSFTGMRLAGVSVPYRAVRGLGSALLPFILLVRAAGHIFGRGQYFLQFAAAVPWMLVFFTSWSFGEWLGWWFGAGDSPQRWQ